LAIEVPNIPEKGQELGVEFFATAYRKIGAISLKGAAQSYAPGAD